MDHKLKLIESRGCKNYINGEHEEKGTITKTRPNDKMGKINPWISLSWCSFDSSEVVRVSFKEFILKKTASFAVPIYSVISVPEEMKWVLKEHVTSFKNFNRAELKSNSFPSTQ